MIYALLAVSLFAVMGTGCSKKAADAQREGRSKKHW